MSLKRIINKTMKRKRGGFLSRAAGSMSDVVSGIRTPRTLSDEKTKEKQEKQEQGNKRKTRAMCFKK